MTVPSKIRRGKGQTPKSKVYVLQHSHVSDDQSEEDVKLIGVYSTADAARAAVRRLSRRPGFRDHPLGFETTEYEIDKDHWTGGFLSWAEANE